MYAGFEKALEAAVASGRIAGAVAAVVAAEPLAELEYAVVVDPLTLFPPDRLESGSEVRLCTVVRFGPTRLLDNLGIGVA